MAAEKSLALNGEEYELSTVMHQAYQYAMEYSFNGGIEEQNDSLKKKESRKKPLIDHDEIKEFLESDNEENKKLLGL